MTYKIQEMLGSYSIQKDNMSIPRSTDNRDYVAFIEAIAMGTDTVEGPDVVSEGYQTLRVYPSTAEQLDMQYWDTVNNTTLWKDVIDSVKAEHPKTIERTVSVGEVPAWVQEEADIWLATKQLREYSTAIERLDQYVLADGREEVRESVVIATEIVLDSDGMPTIDADGNVVMLDTTEEQIVVSAIEAVVATITRTTSDIQSDTQVTEEIENPVITADVAERAEAQSIVDATPAGVIAAYNALV